MLFGMNAPACPPRSCPVVPLNCATLYSGAIEKCCSIGSIVIGPPWFTGGAEVCADATAAITPNVTTAASVISFCVFVIVRSLEIEIDACALLPGQAHVQRRRF